jgi:hypothetical protein
VRANAGCAIVIGLLVAAFAGVAASVDWARPVTIAEAGSGAGQVKRPISVGVDQASGAVFVADSYNNRVDEFGAGGEFLLAWGFGVVNGAEELQVCTPVSGCRAGIPTGELQAARRGEPGSFDGEEGGLAVDPPSAGSSAGDVWVSDRERIQEFRVEPKGGPGGAPAVRGVQVIAGSQFAERKNPLAVDGAGDLWVGDSKGVQEFEASGARKTTLAVAGLGETMALAVSESGADVFVIGSAVTGVREYETVGGKQVGFTIDSAGEPQTLALDEAGDLFVGGECGSSFLEYTCPHPYSFKEYDPVVVQVEQFGGEEVLGDPGGPLSGGGTDGIAVDSGGGGRVPALYSASDEIGAGTMVVQRFAVPVPGPLPEDERASKIEPTSATIDASLDPENHTTTYHFEYGTQPGVYSQSTETKTLAGSGYAMETVSADLNGLSPETTYYYRLNASNHCNEANLAEECVVRGEGASFTTPPAVVIESESVLDVSAGSASFEGVLHPQSVRAEWWVEYGAGEGAFDHSTAREPLTATPEGISVSVHVQGLEPSTVYHYRFAASDEREGHAYTSYGQVLPFTTQHASPSLSVLDGRAWEMVSPLQKQGASFRGDGVAGAINQAATNGTAVTYVATASIESSPAGEPALEDVQILSHHGASGWSSRDIASPHEQEWLPEAGRFAEFFAFSPDLAVGLVEPPGYTLLGGAFEQTPYLRRQALCEAPASVDECYLPLVTAENVTSGEKWGGPPGTPRGGGPVKYEAAAPDLGHVVLHSDVPLTAEASGSRVGLYEWSAGRLELVSVLPGEAAAPAGGCPRVSEDRTRHVISADGDRVIWEDICEGNHLYMHEAVAHRTVQLDIVQGGASGGNEPRAVFQDASGDASRVFFSDQQQLTADSHASNGFPDLYVYEANGDGEPEAGVVRDLTVPVRNGETANVLYSIPGTSANGSVAYVVATGVLSEAPNQGGETARAGQPNLYRLERVEAAGRVSWMLTFVATLSPEDGPDWGPDPRGLSKLTAHVSADGRWLAFMSERPLTGYDNRDTVGGQRDEEVFLYDAASRRLVCASCNPSGARPHGIVSTGELSLVDEQNIWNGRWLAGLIPSWDAITLGVGVYQPRYLSASGRLFFDSADGLAPQDVDGTWDVYEYEPTGVGSCATASADYSAAQDGCIGLVSSGISSEESMFLDAGESGNDAFFLTAGKLVAGDTDNAYDVYDAHVCGSGWECPPPTVVSPPCTNTAACQQAPEAQPEVFGAPPSATFSGAGNSSRIDAKKGRAEGVSRARSLARALRACRSKRGRRRQRCERKVRRRYAKTRLKRARRHG